MLRLQRDRLWAKLEQIAASLKERPQKPEVVERRIGKWQGRHSAAANLFQVDVIRDSRHAVGLHIEEDASKLQWAEAAQGAYLLCTNCCEEDPRQLWRWYIHLTEVEDAFRVGKSDLGLRPIYHHRLDRVQAHILVCFLALVMWRYLERWLQSKGLSDCARQVLEQMATIHSMDVILPVKGNTEARLRLVAKPDKLTADVLGRMHLKLPTRPKMIQNVVEKNGGQ